MADDEVQTPKLTGSFQIMSDACRITIAQLEAWRATSIPPAAAIEVDRMILVLTQLWENVATWVHGFVQSEKDKTTNAILAVREEARQLAARYGRDLTSSK